MNTTRLVALLGVATLLLPVVSASNPDTDLKSIMQGLRDNLVEITDGLLIDDYEQMARGASGVAEHPKIPPADIQIVAKALGAEMAAFKQYDTLVHDRAVELAEAANAEDREAAVTAYLAMVEGCLACHQKYRQRVAAALSSTPQ